MWQPKTTDPYGTQHKQLKNWAKQHLPQHCNHCGKTGTLQLDHIKNLKQGGTHTTDNIQWLCPHCHNKKTQQEATQARNNWKRKPEQHPGAKRVG